MSNGASSRMRNRTPCALTPTLVPRATNGLWISESREVENAIRKVYSPFIDTGEVSVASALTTLGQPISWATLRTIDVPTFAPIIRRAWQSPKFCSSTTTRQLNDLSKEVATVAEFADRFLDGRFYDFDEFERLVVAAQS